MAEDKALTRYITRHLVQHDGREYPAGSDFLCADDKAIAALRAARAIALPMELETPESVAEREARLRAENEAMRAELEQLRSTGATQAEKTSRKAKDFGGELDSGAAARI